MQTLFMFHCRLPISSCSQAEALSVCPHHVLVPPRVISCKVPGGRRSLVNKSRRWHTLPSASVPEGFQNPSSDDAGNRIEEDTSMSTGAFCIIEGPETVQDFANLQLQDIRDSIRSRRNKIFLLMEEVRRLRIQQKIKSAENEAPNEDENEMPNFPSFIPFLPPLASSTLKQYYIFCFGLVAAVILFGGFFAPMLELKLGMGGTSYKDFIKNMHLPPQLSEVDPIVASFSGGAVGVISSLMVVEINNVKLQEQKRCTYCHGTGNVPNMSLYRNGNGK
ncbi:hypothetical protein KP509_04G055100 [Ceratopteris richardii]|uniref:Uncharacterized protein n=1 Tax=Ceratopteris richardii TaxID=49495 RepID=A0A8T2V0I3_CERRI|nr:hypothetical protein KP509_04G055100 [Ceratopteris richardii]